MIIDQIFKYFILSYNILNQDGKAAFGAIYFLTRPMPYPADTQSLARELNRRTLDWCQDTQLKAWKEPILHEKAVQLRQRASEYWRKAQYCELKARWGRERTRKFQFWHNARKSTKKELSDVQITAIGYR